MSCAGPKNSSIYDQNAIKLSEKPQDPTTQIVVELRRSLLPYNTAKWAQIREVQFIVARENFNIAIMGVRSEQDIDKDEYQNGDVNGTYDGSSRGLYIAYKIPLCKLTTCSPGAPNASKGSTGPLGSWLERGAEFSASELDFPIRLVIGADKCSKGAPCNGPLQPGTTYRYVYRVCNQHHSLLDATRNHRVLCNAFTIKTQNNKN